MNAPQPSVIDEIRGVFVYQRRREGESFVTFSPPSHLLHLVIRGEVVQRCNGREYHLRPGDMLWYHESELVEGRCRRAPWQFYSVVFHAPNLPPPGFDARCWRPAGVALREFRTLYRAWNDSGGDGLRRSLCCHAALARILLTHRTVSAPSGKMDDSWLVRLWWGVENKVRQDLGRSYTLEDLAEMAGVSIATLHRASMAAVGVPPVRHVKQLRLEMARGLVIYSDLPITRIAEQTGYERVNELSRDMRKAFGIAPSEIRRAANRPGKV